MSAQRVGSDQQEDLLRMLLQLTFNHLLALEPVSCGERARVLKAALTAIRDWPEDVLTVGDLCRTTKASERTLHYAFTEHFGMPPAHYTRVRRLNGARNDLCREPPIKVSDAANRWGFWHLGQFANDYENLFGELPSDTSGDVTALSSTVVLDPRAARGAAAALATSKMGQTEVCSFLMLRHSAA